MASSSASPRPRPVVLCVLGGVGERAEREGNAVRLARTPSLDALAARPRATLAAAGPALGLREGRPGSGEASWLALGAGRAPQLVEPRVDRAIDDDRLGNDEMLRRVRFLLGDRRDARLHLFALVSEGGVHGSLRHLYAMLEALDFFDVKPIVHAILDGRDAPPKSAWRWLEPLQHKLERRGTLGTIAGRHFALDRDGRWDLTHRYWRAVVKADCPRVDDAFEALRAAYDEGTTDAMIEPVRLGDYDGVHGSFMADFGAGAPRWDWHGEDVAFALFHRADRLRQLAALLRVQDVPPEVVELVTERGRVFHAFDYQSLTMLADPDPTLALPTSFPPERVADTLGEVVARAGLRQLRVGPPASWPHLARYFAGHGAAPLEGEERLFPPSAPDAPTSPEVARAAVAAIEAGAHDLVVVSLPDADRAAHTGSLEATIRAVEAVDEAVGSIVRATLAAGGALVLTADHGNAEDLVGADGPRPMHTAAPVPLVLVDDARAGVTLASGSLVDVAPTVIDLLGLEAPAAMTGRSLVVRG